jgi:hypothetical protein
MFVFVYVCTMHSILTSATIFKTGFYGARHEVRPEATSKVPLGDKVDAGIGLPMVNVLESTLEWT